MEAAALSRPRAVTIVGWVWLVMASLRCLECVVALLVVQVGGLRELPFIPVWTERAKIQLVGGQFGVRYVVPLLLVQIVIAGLVAWFAFELLRLKPWARKAIHATALLGILAAVTVGGFVYTWTARVAPAAGPEEEQVRMAGMVVAGLIGILAAAVFGLTIGLLSRPSVRRAFERSS